MSKDEALKLALEALETYQQANKFLDVCNPAITAIKEALAQSEQEPVAIVEASWNDDEGFMLVKRLAEKLPKGSHLYTTPPQRTWVGLTEEEIDQGLLRSDYAFKTAEAWRAGVVFAMTKLKEKNNG